ncbi:MAG: SGNH/GDSL hydrolase family protein [Gemmatimonas sp.]
MSGGWELVPRPWRAGAWAAAVVAAMAAATATAEEQAAVPDLVLPPRDMCAVPRSLLPSVSSLRHIHAAWVRGEPIVIVTIGSGSTAGSTSGGESHAYPNYLQAQLAAKFPNREIKVVNHGHPGESAQKLAARFPTEVVPDKPNLVIWQTGTVDAVRSLDVDTFATTVNGGIAFLEASRSDVVLVNPQYASRMELLIHYDPYLAAMEQAAGQSDAILFDRYRVMRYWVAKGRFDLSSGSREVRRKNAEESQACIGVVLGDVIARALQ